MRPSQSFQVFSISSHEERKSIQTNRNDVYSEDQEEHVETDEENLKQKEKTYKKNQMRIYTRSVARKFSGLENFERTRPSKPKKAIL